ncbi:MAG: AI-2E family transporter [Clostridia bacterium]|nr:AI-2E family transporter [Clostridia bacterium]
MKVTWNKKYTTIAVYACIVILFAVLCCFFFLGNSDLGGYLKSFISVFSPILYGVLFAYLLNPILRFFETNVFKKGRRLKPAARRALSLLCTGVVLLIVIALFFLIVIPQISDGYRDLSSKLPLYISSFQTWLTSVTEGKKLFADIASNLVSYINELISRSYELIQIVLPSVSSVVVFVANLLKNALLGIIFAFYFLLSKEKLSAQIKKVFAAVLSDKRYNKLIYYTRVTDHTFGRFVTGTILDSVIFGVMCLLLMMIFGVPYYPLFSLTLAITNIIPFFGPFIGSIPCVFVLLVSDPVSTIYFILIVIVVKQVDTKLIIPRFHATSTGLSSAWVVIGITLMWGLIGAWGLLLGVPVFAVMYALVKGFSEKKLRAKGKPDSSNAYNTYNELYIDRENRKHLLKRIFQSDAMKRFYGKRFPQFVVRVYKKSVVLPFIVDLIKKLFKPLSNTESPEMISFMDIAETEDDRISIHNPVERNFTIASEQLQELTEVDEREDVIYSALILSCLQKGIRSQEIRALFKKYVSAYYTFGSYDIFKRMKDSSGGTSEGIAELLTENGETKVKIVELLELFSETFKTQTEKSFI